MSRHKRNRGDRWGFLPHGPARLHAVRLPVRPEREETRADPLPEPKRGWREEQAVRALEED